MGQGPSPRRRLDGWKEIATHLGRDPRTAQRWEALEGLPVYREGAKVFALSDELDQWRWARTIGPSGENDPTPAASPPLHPEELRRPLFRPRLAYALAATVVTILAVWLLGNRVLGPVPQPPPRIGRILARSTSEGRTLRRIALPHVPAFMVLSPRGDRLFAVAAHGRELSIVRTADGSATSLALPQDGGPLAVSPDGKLYAGSLVDGVMVIDITHDPVVASTIPTGGPVCGMALTPDGGKLYLAMSQFGVKRLSTRSGKLVSVTDQVCPEQLAIDPQGKHLYVAYQCSGPSGSPGHDSVEVFDVQNEVSQRIINGLPMVGWLPNISPDGTKLLLSGGDACSNPHYDHAGCKVVPSIVYHLLRTSDGQRLWSKEPPESDAGSVQFIDNSRVLMAARTASVIGVAGYSVIEKADLGGDSFHAIAISADGSRVYIGTTVFSTRHAILVLDPEDATCSPPPLGLSILFTGDGTFESADGMSDLRPQGSVRFVPGRVGQALFLTPNSSLSAWTGHLKFGTHDLTAAFYVKAADLNGEATLVDWTEEQPRRGMRLLKSADNHFVFQSWPGASRLQSRTMVQANTWYHVTATLTDRQSALYVNGVLEDSGGGPGRLQKGLWARISLGGLSSGQSGFHGWLDEIAFYDRALTSQEVTSLYQQRESTPCK